MQVSKTQVNKQVEKKIFKELYKVLADFRKPKQVESFFKDVLSETERTVIAKRLGIAQMLHQGKSYKEIKDSLKVSSATIASVSSWLEKGGEGLKLAIRVIEAEEWAEELSGKITNSVKKVLGK